MNRKPARIAVTALIAVLSVVGLSQAGSPSVVSAGRGGDSWCC